MGAERADRPFVDAPVGPGSEPDRVAESAAERWELPEPTLLRRGMNALYRAGDAVIRVGRPTAEPNAGLLLVDALAEQGVPVLHPLRSDVVVDGDLVASAWPYAEPARGAADWEAIGRIVRQIHDLDPASLPTVYPVPHPTSFEWWDFESLVAEVGDDIDPAALSGLSAAIDRHGGWAAAGAGTEVVCHGDVHPGNVLVADGRSLLIDWDLLCWAPPGWDHAMLQSYAERWGGSPDVLPAFERGYGHSMSGDPVTVSVAALRNVAATLMRVRAGRHDPSARTEAERRLRFWRGDPEAPTWRAQ